MSALRVQTPDQTVDETRPAVIPFVQRDTEKPEACQFRSPRLPAANGMNARIKLLGYLIEQSVEETTKLSVGRSPIAARVSIEGLFKMSLGRRESVPFQQLHQFGPNTRQPDIRGKRRPQRPVRDDESILLKNTPECVHFLRRRE